MEHEYTLPARVVEITRRGPRDEEPDTDESPPASRPAAGEGAPDEAVRRPQGDAR
jgi:hypothetical protein